MGRWIGVVAGIAVLLALTAAAQPARVLAPERNAETGLAFPSTIGPARKVGSIDYAQSNGAPELGYAWNYETQAITTTTFYIYNSGIAEIPSGARGNVVLTQFQQAIADIEEDEMVEVKQKSIRLRKAVLNPSFRKKRVRED